jgi:DNA-binding GntR family transcriptional regulator
VVVRTVRDAILRGRLKAGDRLQQDKLAQQLHVSRQPVREALRRLQSEGLVVQLPQRWMAVREFSAHEILENSRIRLILEPEAARIAAERILPEEIDALRSINRTMAQMISAGDLSPVAALNAEFHHRVYEAARMPTLTRLIEQLWVGRAILTPPFIPGGRGRRTVDEHAALVRALERRSPSGAAKAMRDHIARAADEYARQRSTVHARTGADPARPAGPARAAARARGGRKGPGAGKAGRSRPTATP